MVRKQRVIAVSILLALSLMVSLTPLSFAAGGGPDSTRFLATLQSRIQGAHRRPESARAPEGMTVVAHGS